MRHQKSGKRLGVNSEHKRAMVRNLVTSLLEHGRITTTLTRAKEIRGDVDHMIGLGKRADLHARRQALSFVKSKIAMANLFGEIAERLKERPGGYSRIMASGPRRGDGAQMAIMQLVGGEDDPFAEGGDGKAKPKRGGKAAKGKTVAEEVAAGASAKGEAAGGKKAKPKRAPKEKANK